jgi:hypothetical protein
MPENDFGVTQKRLAELCLEGVARQIAKRAFDAGRKIGHWEPGISGDHPGYETFDEWWEKD